MLLERFPYMLYSPRMLPEYFLNTPGLHILMDDENYVNHAQIRFGATKWRSVCIRTKPNSQYAQRTHRMRPEFEPFASPISIFLFTKQTEWLSGRFLLLAIYRVFVKYTLYWRFGRKACKKHMERVWYIIDPFAVFWKQSESMRKAFRKETEIKRKVFVNWRNLIHRDIRPVSKIHTNFVFGKHTEWHSGK